MEFSWEILLLKVASMLYFLIPYRQPFQIGGCSNVNAKLASVYQGAMEFWMWIDFQSMNNF
jgi:hypothetical protein